MTFCTCTHTKIGEEIVGLLKSIFGGQNVYSGDSILTNECKDVRKISRVLAGSSFTKSRKLFLETPRDKRMNDPPCIMGIGLTTPFKEKEIIVSVWKRDLIVTFCCSDSSILTKLLQDIQNEQLLPQYIDSNYIGDIESKIRELLEGKHSFLLITKDGNIKTSLPSMETREAPVILSGSFNPLHKGHVDMLEQAAVWKYPKAERYFELSIHNADKPTLELAVILDRASQFAGKFNIILSAEPFFVDKAKLFAPCRFIVGYDTAERILDPKYYKNSESLMLEQLRLFQEASAEFLVCGRTVNGTWMDILPKVDIPELFTPIPREIFSNDISSKQLREQGIAVVIY